MKEKTIPKAVPRRVKGTVLFTVVAVMMVLIVFLMGTLALAVSANNRAVASMEKVQTETAARAAIDAVARAINEDTESKGIRKDIISSGKVDVALSDKAGQEAYHVTVTKSADARDVYDATQEKWVSQDVYDLTVYVGDKILAETTYNASLSVAVEPVTGVGGAFVSMGQATRSATGGYITGGTYVGVDLATYPPAPGFVYEIVQNNTLIDAPFYSGYDTKTDNHTLVHFTGTGDYFAVNADLSINGGDGQGLECVYTDDFAWIDKEYKQLPYIYIGGALKSTQSVLKVGTDKVATNLYVGEVFNPNDLNNGAILEVYGDLFCFSDTGNTYLGNTAKSSKLYEWTKETITGKPSKNGVMGNAFIKNNIRFTGNPTIIEGDLRVGHDAVLDSSVVVTGDVVVEGTLEVKSGKKLTCKNIYAGTIQNNGTIDASSVNYVTAYNGPSLSKVTVTAINKTWYTDINISNATPFNEKGWGTDYHITYSYVRHTQKFEADGVTPIDATPSEQTISNTEDKTINHAWMVPFAAGDPALTEAICQAIGCNSSADSLANAINNPETRSDTMSANSISSVSVAYGESAYPDAYSATNIKTTIGLSIPQKTGYDAYYTKASDLSIPMTITDLSSLNSKTTSDANTDSTPYFLNSDGYYEVRKSCCFDGVTFDKNLYINSKDIVVELKNCTFNMGYNIIYNEYGKGDGTNATTPGESTVFVTGTLNMSDKNAIVTKYYWDTLWGNPALSANGVTDWSINKTLDIHQIVGVDPTTNTFKADEYEKYPKLIIKSDEPQGGTNPKLNMNGNNSLITALIRAPQMDFVQNMAFDATSHGLQINYTTGKGDKVTYGKNANLPSTDLGNTGVIGQLIAADISMNGNAKWGLVYIALPNEAGHNGGSFIVKDMDVMYYNLY